MTTDRYSVWIDEGIRLLKAERYQEARVSLAKATKEMYQMYKDGDEGILQRADQLYSLVKRMDRCMGNEKKKKEVPLPKENVPVESDSLPFNFMKAPDISFDDVVGLKEVKDAIYRRIIAPRQNPDLAKKYKMKIGGGVLLYGPPGTGKTMVVQAIAHELNAKFFSVSCSELVSKFFGGMEQNIKRLFDTVRKESGTKVLFLDEFDSIGVSRNNNRSTVMSRAVPELLAQIQGTASYDSNDSILLVVATNIPWALDSGFLRPGRLDERIFVGLPDDEARMGIMKKELSGIPCDQMDLKEVVEATNGYNAADIVNIIGRAKYYPYERELIHYTGNEKITMEDLYKAVEKTPSSVQKEDMARLLKWKRENE